MVTRRTVEAIARRAAADCYGIVAVSGPRPSDDLLGWLGLATPGVRARLGRRLHIELFVSVARGVPVAEVARNLEEAVGYVLTEALGTRPVELVVHVDGIRVAAPSRGGRSSGRRGRSGREPSVDPGARDA